MKKKIKKMTEFAKMCFMNMRKSNFGKCEERKISVPQYIARNVPFDNLLMKLNYFLRVECFRGRG